MIIVYSFGIWTKQFHSVWYITSNTKILYLRKTFKSYFKYKNTQHRITLTRIRLSSHNLEIKKGRPQNIPSDQRKCKLCTLGQIESEHHFLLICPIYTEVRNKSIKPFYYGWSSLYKFSKLLSTENKTEMINQSFFFFFCYEIKKWLQVLTLWNVCFFPSLLFF